MNDTSKDSLGDTDQWRETVDYLPPPVLSRRDEFAKAIAHGQLAHEGLWTNGTWRGNKGQGTELFAQWVVAQTDALIAELDKDKEQNNG